MTSEKSLKFLLNLNEDFNVDIALNTSHWHPYRPSLEIDFLSIKKSGNPTDLLTVDTLKVNLNLLSFIEGSLVENLYSKNTHLIINLSDNTNPSDFRYLESLLILVNNLKIASFSIIDSRDKFDGLRGKLTLLNPPYGSSKLRLYAEDRDGGNIDLRINSIFGSTNLKDFKGFLKTSNLNIEKGIINKLCTVCLSGKLDNQIFFTTIDSKLVKLTGYLGYKFSSSLDFVDSFHATVKLEDSKSNTFRISPYLNSKKENLLPEFFSSISFEEISFYVPEISLGHQKVVDKIFLSFAPSGLVVKGSIKNLIFQFGNNIELNADLNQISLSYKDISVNGLQGNVQYIPNKTKLYINTPFLEIDNQSLYDSSLIFNNISSVINISTIDNKFSIPLSDFEGIYKDSSIKGNLKYLPSPHEGNGDLSISAISDDLSYSSVFSLFPNFDNVKGIKNWLQTSISCGSIKQASFIFRTPINNKPNNSNPSFISKGSFNEACLNLNGNEIKNIRLDFKLNNSSFTGIMKEGNLFGSSLKGTIKTFKRNNQNIIEVKGNSEGPLTSLLQISNLNTIFTSESKSSGKHNTSFNFASPLSSSIKLLGGNSILKFSTKIRDGNLTNKGINLKLTNLYSSIEYDSLSGVKDSSASLRINEVPLQFDIRKKQANGKIFTSLSAQNTFPAKSISSFINLKEEISGSSIFGIEISLASFIRGKKISKPEIKIFSELIGLSIDLPEPLRKNKESTINLNLLLQPIISDGSSRLIFTYGDLFRGKLDFKENGKEGFVIAGKKKQNISIQQDKVQLVGEIKRLNLKDFISSELFSTEGEGNFFIKDLFVHEIYLSNLSLVKTNIRSSRSKDAIEFSFINEDLSGKLIIPDEKRRRIALKLDYLTVNFEENDTKDNFLSLFNSIQESFNFSTEAIFINGIDYGEWQFSVLPKSNLLILNDIEGAYGKWGVKKDKNGISSLKISKNSFGWTSILQANIYSGSPEKAFIQIGIEPNFEMDVFNVDTNLKWDNLPWLIDSKSISGDFSLNLYGLTIQNRENLDRTNNLLRLVNIFNITDSFEKVTNLDFRKLYKRGFNTDRVTGAFSINKDSLTIKEPILLTSGSSKFKWTGNLSRNTKGEISELDLEVVMTLPLREYLPAYALILGGPLTAGVVYIAGKAFEKNLDQLSSGKWKIYGDIAEPKTEFKGWFEDRKK